MKRWTAFFLFFCWSSSFAAQPEFSEDKAFVIVIPSYNNKNFYLRNLDSVVSQSYRNFRVIYIDDSSVDGTGECVERYIHDNHFEEKFTLIKNQTRAGALANIYKAIHKSHSDEIVVTLDGDDWFAHDQVLDRLCQEYQDSDVWMTYGQFAWFLGEGLKLIPGICEELPEDVILSNSIRQYKWATSQLRTFYAGLFHQIKQPDLFYDGDFFQMAGDVAFMLPLIELAGTHVRFIPDLLYIYNRTTPGNDDKINRNLQLTLDLEVRSRGKYTPARSYHLPEQESSSNLYISKGQWGDLFAEGHPIYDRDNSLAPMIALRRSLAENGIDLHQVDSFKNLENPLAVISFEVPTNEQLQDLLKYPYESRILFLWEPISTAPENYNRDIHNCFSRIYTWDDSLVDNEKYFKFFYPRMNKMIDEIIPFDQRKLVCGISCNKTSFHPDELYSERIKLYDFFDRTCPNDFDLFGRWWSKDRFQSYGGLVDKKVDTMKSYKFCICYENIDGVPGYVTEKIFDVFHAGSIPIYLGAPNIAEYVPRDCFIDRRQFESDQKLYEYLSTVTEEKYLSYIENIQKYLESTKAALYSVDAFTRKISADFLKSKTPYYFCTAANAEYFRPLLNLIGSIHKQHFNVLGEIAIFDLGLEEEQLQLLKTIEKVAVYPLEMIHGDLLKSCQTRSWGKYVPGWYAWKPVCIKQGLELFPDFLWIDAGTTIARSIDPLFSYMREHGYFFHNGSDWSLKRMTTEYVVNQFQLWAPQNVWMLDDNVQGIESGLMGITPEIKEAFVRPAYEMSSNLAAFIDDGSSSGGFGSGRHDQTLFSIFALQNDLEIFHHFNEPDQDFILEDHPFHIACNQVDCKEETHVYCSRNDFNLSDYYPYIHFKK